MSQIKFVLIILMRMMRMVIAAILPTSPSASNPGIFNKEGGGAQTLFDKKSAGVWCHTQSGALFLQNTGACTGCTLPSLDGAVLSDGNHI